MKKSKLNLQDILAPISEDLKIFEVALSKIFAPKNPLVEKICHYAIKSGGKRLRPALVFLFAGLNGKITPQHHALSCAVELIHNATLIHDDIVDDADTRHNLPTIHTKWDTKSAVLAGDFLLAEALICLVKTESKEVLELFSVATKDICRGEIEEFANKKTLSVEEYFARAKRKTGQLFNLCTQGACMICGNKNLSAAENFATNLGIAFQIVDDILPFKENYDEKTTTADFDNAIFTLPVILAAKEGVSVDFKDFGAFVDQIKKTNAIDKSYEFALEYTRRAIESIADFGDNRYKEAITNLANYIVEREF